MNGAEGSNGWERTHCLMSRPAGSAVTLVYGLGLRKKGCHRGSRISGWDSSGGPALFREGKKKSWVRK